MADPVKTRRYKSALRAQQATRTRRAVLAAARELFERQGYAGTAVSDIAGAAGVSLDTVYTSIGRKPQLLLAVVDMLLAGADEPLPAEERDYVRAIRAAGSAEDKIRVYTRALGELLPRTAPLLDALREAARSDPGCAEVWAQLGERRAANMLLFAADLRATGALREELSDREVADVVWSTSSVEHYRLLTGRGWSAERFAALLADLWIRLLLA